MGVRSRSKFLLLFLVCFFGVISFFWFCKKGVVKSSSIALLTVNLGFSLGILQQDQFYSRNMLVYKNKTDHFSTIVYLPSFDLSKILLFQSNFIEVICLFEWHLSGFFSELNSPQKDRIWENCKTAGNFPACSAVSQPSLPEYKLGGIL